MTPNAFSKRLAHARRNLNLSQQAVADELAVSRAAVSQWEAGRTMPSSGKVAALAELLSVSPQFLLSGTGPLNDAPPEDNSLIPELDVRASAGAGSVVDIEDKIEAWKFPDRWVRTELNSSPSDLRIISIEGDSMVSTPPKIDDLRSGDKVVVNIADRIPTPPGIFIVHDGLGLVAKQVEHVPHSDPPSINIGSRNERYTTYSRTLDEAAILGRVIGKWQRV